jgi:Domain of unknown function (DUF4286)
MNRLIYTVLAEFDDSVVCDEFIAWLADDHAAKVIKAGALSAEVTRLEPDPPNESHRVEVRYRFSDQNAFDQYLADGAPRLREEGLARFGPERGVRMSRCIGDLRLEITIGDESL